MSNTAPIIKEIKRFVSYDINHLVHHNSRLTGASVQYMAGCHMTLSPTYSEGHCVWAVCHCLSLLRCLCLSVFPCRSVFLPQACLHWGRWGVVQYLLGNEASQMTVIRYSSGRGFKNDYLRSFSLLYLFHYVSKSEFWIRILILVLILVLIVILPPF